MDNLQKKILKKVYKYETLKTLGYLLTRALAVILLFLGMIFLLQAIIQYYLASQTLDLLQLFTEDFDTIRQYFWDTLYIIYIESPKFRLTILGIIIFLFLILILTIVKNFVKIKRKVSLLIKFWIK